MSRLPALCQDGQVLDAISVVKNHCGCSCSEILRGGGNKKKNKTKQSISKSIRRHYPVGM